MLNKWIFIAIFSLVTAIAWFTRPFFYPQLFAYSSQQTISQRNNASDSLRPTEDAAKTLKKYSYSRLQMAMPLHITVWCESQEKAEAACIAAFEHAAKLEKVFSDYRSESEVSRLCRQETNRPIVVSHHLLKVLEFSKRLFSRSTEAFDPTAAPVIKLWRKSRKSKQLPDSKLLQTTIQNTGLEKIQIDPKQSTVTLLAERLSLDFGGIAKGYIGDEVLRVLRKHGISIACYEAGGDIVLGDPPPSSAGWSIDIEKKKDGSSTTVYLKNCGVSTSGDSVQFVEIGGKRYSHVVDPRTGIGLTNGQASVVVADTGMQSDALATTGCVLDKSKFRELAREFGAKSVWLKTGSDQNSERQFEKIPLTDF